MQVELVAHTPMDSVSGIGRYRRELYRYMSPLVPMRVVRPISPPFASRFAFLNAFPVGLDRHVPGSIVHFTQIVGCSQMLWRPVHPAVATVHDLGVLLCEEDEMVLDRFARRVLDLQLAGLRRMDHFIVRSSHARDNLIAQLGIAEERIGLVRASIDTKLLRPMPLARARECIGQHYGVNLQDGVPALMYLGSELPRKNLEVLLQAMALLKARGQRARLLKVGAAGGERWRACFTGAMDRLGLSEDVILFGVVPDEHVPWFFNAADIVVTPTLLEAGFAWLAKGAMVCARPAVVASTALVPDEARDAVLIVPPRDPEAWAGAIQQCIDHPELRERLGRLGSQVIQAFKPEEEAAGVLEVYKRLANSQD